MGKGLRRWEIKRRGVFLLQREKGCGFGEGAAARKGVLVGRAGCRFDGGRGGVSCCDYITIFQFRVTA